MSDAPPTSTAGTGSAPTTPEPGSAPGGTRRTATFTVKRGLADMLRGGVIMDVVTAEQAKHRRGRRRRGGDGARARALPTSGRDGGVARMSDPALIEAIQAAVTIPVMAKARIGHFAEAQILEALAVDYIDESEVLTPADEAHHIDKWAFTVPVRLRRHQPRARRCGASPRARAMIRSKGEAGTGNVVEAVRHLRSILGDIRALTAADSAELYGWAKDLQAPVELVQEVAETGRLPVPLFCAGGIATPADAALVMQLGAEAVFVGSGIFKSEDPARRARAIVEATTHFDDPADPRQGEPGPGQRRCAGRDRDARDAARRARLVSARRPRAAESGHRVPQVLVGVLALQGDVAEHPPRSTDLGVDAGRCAGRPDLARRRRPRRCPAASRPPCRCCCQSSGLLEPLRRAARRRPAASSAPAPA